MNTPSQSARRGSILVYAVFGTLALAGMAALAVDWGRVQVVKTELQAAADAAARYAAAGLQNGLMGQSAAPANAAAVAAQNKDNGRAIVFDRNADIEIGVWKASQRTFTPTTDLPSANAVRVKLRCTAARGNAVPMTFLSVLGKNSADVTATSIATVEYTGKANGLYDYFLPATSNPWLAGMPEGTIASVNNPHQNPDYAGKAFLDDGLEDKLQKAKGSGFVAGGSTTAGSSLLNYLSWGEYAAKKASPIQAGTITVSGGRTVTFDGVNGGANNQSSSTNFDADGNAGWVVSNSAGAENGIANVSAPINSIIGVFLGDAVPNHTAAPADLSFTTPASRDFTTLMPQLKQPFFIGDGRTSTGEVQQFVPPAGATRLFICTMDAYEWSNNQGGFFVTVHTTGKVTTVME